MVIVPTWVPVLSFQCPNYPAPQRYKCRSGGRAISSRLWSPSISGSQGRGRKKSMYNNTGDRSLPCGRAGLGGFGLASVQTETIIPHGPPRFVLSQASGATRARVSPIQSVANSKGNTRDLAQSIDSAVESRVCPGVKLLVSVTRATHPLTYMQPLFLRPPDQLQPQPECHPPEG